MVDKLSAPLDEFKEREIEILNLMAEGYTNREIADHLFITKETVRWYNKQIYSKLGTSRRTEAIALARSMGLIDDNQPTDNLSQTITHTPPLTIGPFIGRESEMSELRTLLSEPNVRLLSIIATGGMGKSRLSLELGHSLKDNYQAGVAFIDLTSIHNPEDISQFLLSSLGVSTSNQSSPRDVLFNYCREKELLLIFDNFEHILDGAKFLAELLEVAPHLQVIATSRERLNLRAETVFQLQPMTKQAHQLFLEVAHMMHPNINLTDEGKHIQKIVELVGGLPLALVLASTWLDTLSVSEIAQEIEHSLDFLSAELGDMPARQQSIQAVIDPTWKRLKPLEQQAFMKISIFRGGFTRELFQQVTGASIRTLQTLLSRSLITHGYGKRYDMHPLLRQYAYEKLDEYNLVHQTHKIHLEVLLEYAQHQKERKHQGFYLESLEVLDTEQDNFRVALDWSLQDNEIDTGVSLILNLCHFWMIRSQSSQALKYLEEVLKHRQSASLYSELSAFQHRLGQIDSADESIQEAFTLAHEIDNKGQLSQIYRRKAIYQKYENQQQTYQHYRHALDLALETDSKNLIADAYLSLAVFLREASEIDEALQYNQNALEIYEKLGDLRGISMATYNMAVHYASIGDSQGARELCEYSLRIKYQIGDKAGAARRLSALAFWDISEEEYEQAQKNIEESIAICREIGDIRRLNYTLTVQSFLYIIMGNYLQAQNILQQTLPSVIKTQNVLRLSDIYNQLALLALLQNQLQQLEHYISEAIKTNAKMPTVVWFSLVTYANYLEYTQNLHQCLRTAIVLYHNKEQYGINNQPLNQYFFEPLIYRIQQKIDTQAWQTALNDFAHITVDELFQEILESFG